MSEDNSHMEREERRISSQNLATWKVLIVDDQKDNLEVAEMVLKFHGASVMIAHSGLEGLEALSVLQTLRARLIGHNEAA